MLGVRFDRFDHQVKFIGAVDFAKDAVGLIGQDALGFGEVVEPIDAVGIAVFHDLQPLNREFHVAAGKKHHEILCAVIQEE